MRRTTALIAIIAVVPAVIAIGAPLIGVVSGIIDPPPRLFAASSHSLWELLTGLGTPTLLLRSVALALAVALTAMVIGTWLAWCEQRYRYAGGRWLALAALLPLATPSYLLASVLRQGLSPGGMVGDAFGLPPFSGFIAAWVVLSLICTPFVQLIVAAALARSSAAEDEAARSLGAGPWLRLRAVWFPRLRPAWAASVVLVVLYALSDFGAVAVLDCPVLTWRLYQEVDLARYGEAAALGAALLAATVPLVIAARLLSGHLRGSGAATVMRSAERQPLTGALLILTWVLHLVVIGGGVVAPVACCVVWLVDGMANPAWQFAAISEPLRHSLVVVLLGTVVVLACAIGPAWIAGRTSGRLAGGLEHGTYLTGAIPGVLLATGLILLARTLTRASDGALAENMAALGLPTGGALYALLGGSGALLAIGYAGRFLPEAFAPLRAGAQTIDPRQTECARTLGANAWTRTRRLHLPAMAPALAAAAVLVAVAILKELPLTLMLGNAFGLRPLSYRVWAANEELHLPDVGLAGLLLMALALATVVVTLRVRRHA